MADAIVSCARAIKRGTNQLPPGPANGHMSGHGHARALRMARSPQGRQLIDPFASMLDVNQCLSLSIIWPCSTVAERPLHLLCTMPFSFPSARYDRREGRHHRDCAIIEAAWLRLWYLFRIACAGSAGQPSSSHVPAFRPRNKSAASALVLATSLEPPAASRLQNPRVLQAKRRAAISREVWTMRSALLHGLRISLAGQPGPTLQYRVASPHAHSRNIRVELPLDASSPSSFSMRRGHGAGRRSIARCRAAKGPWATGDDQRPKIFDRRLRHLHAFTVRRVTED